ncbi:hypothetical protein VTN00DRAFT_2255 [Thermoascus crustaceus]|uniref:uncharacterized protein n=1 Tax=Thermoascus crustaceus TaxID=5088 RepID=UPI0037420C9C
MAEANEDSGGENTGSAARSTQPDPCPQDVQGQDIMQWSTTNEFIHENKQKGVPQGPKPTHILIIRRPLKCINLFPKSRLIDTPLHRTHPRTSPNTPPTNAGKPKAQSESRLPKENLR